MKSVYQRVCTYIEKHGDQDEKGSYWNWFARPITVGKKTFYGMKRQAEAPALLVDEEAARSLLKRKGISLDDAEYWVIDLPEKLTKAQAARLLQVAASLKLPCSGHEEYDLDDLLYRLASEKKISEAELDKVLLSGIWKGGEFVEGEVKYSLCVVEEPPVNAE
jgi:hypothetical protein